jgi:hypothetical protein
VSGDVDRFWFVAVRAIGKLLLLRRLVKAVGEVDSCTDVGGRYLVTADCVACSLTRLDLLNLELA